MAPLLQDSALNALGATVPVPLRPITAVPLVEELLVMVNCPVAVPATAGLNCTFGRVGNVNSLWRQESLGPATEKDCPVRLSFPSTVQVLLIRIRFSQYPRRRKEPTRAGNDQRDGSLFYCLVRSYQAAHPNPAIQRTECLASLLEITTGSFFSSLQEPRLAERPRDGLAVGARIGAREHQNRPAGPPRHSDRSWGSAFCSTSVAVTSDG